jgi:hypothetical protein
MFPYFLPYIIPYLSILRHRYAEQQRERTVHPTVRTAETFRVILALTLRHPRTYPPRQIRHTACQYNSRDRGRSRGEVYEWNMRDKTWLRNERNYAVSQEFTDRSRASIAYESREKRWNTKRKYRTYAVRFCAVLYFPALMYDQDGVKWYEYSSCIPFLPPSNPFLPFSLTLSPPSPFPHAQSAVDEGKSDANRSAESSQLDKGDDVIKVKRLSTLVTNIVRNTGTWGGTVADGERSRSSSNWGQDLMRKKNASDAAARKSDQDKLNKLESESLVRMMNGRHVLPPMHMLSDHIVLVQGTYCAVLWRTVLTLFIFLSSLLLFSPRLPSFCFALFCVLFSVLLSIFFVTLLNCRFSLCLLHNYYYYYHYFYFCYCYYY